MIYIIGGAIVLLLSLLFFGVFLFGVCEFLSNLKNPVYEKGLSIAAIILSLVIANVLAFFPLYEYYVFNKYDTYFKQNISSNRLIYSHFDSNRDTNKYYFNLGQIMNIVCVKMDKVSTREYLLDGKRPDIEITYTDENGLDASNFCWLMDESVKSEVLKAFKQILK